MDDGCIPEDLLYGELTTGKQSIGRPKLRFKDLCKRDMKDCPSWRRETAQAGEAHPEGLVEACYSYLNDACAVHYFA